MTRQSSVEQSELVREKYSLLADIVKVLSDPVVRNLGTVGGNIANADPVNDEPATMLAYGAEVVAVGSKGERVIPITAFYLDLYQSALTRDEILTEVRLPFPRLRSGGAYLKLERKVLPFRWVTCDEKYGKIPTFLDGIAALDKWYLAEVPADTRVWLRTPAIEPPGPGLLGRPRIYPRVKRTAPPPLELRALMTQLSHITWQRRKIQEGSKGPLMVGVACARVTPVRDQLPGLRCWAILRRALGAQPETKYYLCNAPADYPQTELAHLTGMRWPIETALEEAKGEVGLDHYETRTWQGWHHHMLHSFLAHLFLMHLRLLFQKKSSAHNRPSSTTGRTRDPGRGNRFTRSLRHLALPSISQPCRLSFSQETYSFTSAPANYESSQRQSLVVITEISL